MLLMYQVDSFLMLPVAEGGALPRVFPPGAGVVVHLGRGAAGSQQGAAAPTSATSTPPPPAGGASPCGCPPVPSVQVRCGSGWVFLHNSSDSIDWRVLQLQLGWDLVSCAAAAAAWQQYWPGGGVLLALLMDPGTCALASAWSFSSVYNVSGVPCAHAVVALPVLLQAPSHQPCPVGSVWVRLLLPLYLQPRQRAP